MCHFIMMSSYSSYIKNHPKCVLINRTVIICLFSQPFTFHPHQLVTLFQNYAFFINLLTISFIFLLIILSTNLLQVIILLIKSSSHLFHPYYLPICFTKLICPFHSLSLWNSLPYHVKSSLSLITFKSNVNMFIH